jgi:hypothetical protein
VFDLLPNLQSLIVKNTSLSGAIPPSVLTGPVSVFLTQNNLNALPPSLQPRNCTVNSFHSSSNVITGTSLDVFSTCRRAGTINLSDNLMGPVFATEILNLPRLTNLFLDNNQFASVGFSPKQSAPNPTMNVILSANAFSGPLSDNITKAIVQYGGNWYA